MIYCTSKETSTLLTLKLINYIRLEINFISLNYHNEHDPKHVISHKRIHYSKGEQTSSWRTNPSFEVPAMARMSQAPLRAHRLTNGLLIAIFIIALAS